MRHSRGDKRADGLLFWQYKGPKEVWIDQQDFERRQAHVRKYATRFSLPSERTLRCGDMREDGMVFWAYAKTMPKGQYWVTPEKYAEKRAKNTARMSSGWRRYHDPERKREQRKRDRKTISAKQAERYRADPTYRLALNVRNRLRNYLSSKGKKKTARTRELVGCPPAYLRAFIEFQFLPGMSWENRSEWHIDHFMPLSRANDDAHFRRLCHWTNLRPMWATDNMRKHDRMPTELEIQARECVFVHWNATTRENIAQDFNDQTLTSVECKLIQAKGRSEGQATCDLIFKRPIASFFSATRHG